MDCQEEAVTVAAQEKDEEEFVGEGVGAGVGAAVGLGVEVDGGTCFFF